MDNNYGPECDKDDKFKAKARLHQSKFRAEVLGLQEYNKYGNRLVEEDAEAGKNFYTEFPGLFNEVKKRFRYKYSPLYYDMLRSEHLPFNLFVPLKLEPGMRLAKDVFNIFLEDTIEKIEEIHIEYAPQPKTDYLNDNTSFDVFVEYLHVDGSKGAIGIEVKYTERDYPWGRTEKKRMHDPKSVYHRLTTLSRIYRGGSRQQLMTQKLKQFWRNQLLGEAILRNDDYKLDRFTMILLLPSGNKHMLELSSEYNGLLLWDDKFKTMLLEDFIVVGRSMTTNQSYLDWLDYVWSRYVISEANESKRMQVLTLPKEAWEKVGGTRFLYLSDDQKDKWEQEFNRIALRRIVNDPYMTDDDLAEVLSDAVDRSGHIARTNSMSRAEFIDSTEGLAESIIDSYKDIAEADPKINVRSFVAIIQSELEQKEKEIDQWDLSYNFRVFMIFYFEIRRYLGKSKPLKAEVDEKLNRYGESFLKEVKTFYDYFKALRLNWDISAMGDGLGRQEVDSFLSGYLSHLERNGLISEPVVFRHSIDFTTVVVNHQDYSFNLRQACIVKILYEAYLNGTPDVHGRTLIVTCDKDFAGKPRLRDFFKDSPAWNSLIVGGGKEGLYRLNL